MYELRGKRHMITGLWQFRWYQEASWSSYRPYQYLLNMIRFSDFRLVEVLRFLENVTGGGEVEAMRWMIARLYWSDRDILWFLSITGQHGQGLAIVARCSQPIKLTILQPEPQTNFLSPLLGVTPENKSTAPLHSTGTYKTLRPSSI